MTSTSSIPLDFICPITHEIMEIPVLLVEDGHSYEKSALERWFKERNTSPWTNNELQTQQFVINYNLKSAIEQFRSSHKIIDSKLHFRSFALHRGRPQNTDWKNHPKLQIVLSLLGASGSGKSCLAANIEYGQPQNNSRERVTLAVDVFFFHLDQLFEDKYVVIVQINDCPGNDRFEAVSDRHFRNCHGAVLMVDTTNIETFERLEGYWYKRLREKSAFDHVESVLACNKIDLLEKDRDTSYRDQFFKQADTFVSQHQIPIFNISALRGDNIHMMFHHLISSILQNPVLIKHLKANEMKSNEQQSTKTSSIHLTVPPKMSKDTDKSLCSC